MKTEELIERLSAFNEWRRGAEIPQPKPEDIGEWIDHACRTLDEQAGILRALEVAAQSIANSAQILKQERDEAREALRDIATADWKTSGELRGMARRALEGEIKNPTETQKEPNPNPKGTQQNPKQTDR